MNQETRRLVDEFLRTILQGALPEETLANGKSKEAFDALSIRVLPPVDYEKMKVDE
jgi:hypothetical protein